MLTQLVLLAVLLAVLANTEMLIEDAPSLEAWLENTAKAIETAAGN
jgi:hypothetical protein